MAVYAEKTLRAIGVNQNYILSRGKATIEELYNELKIFYRELEIQIVILLHLELIDDEKEKQNLHSFILSVNNFFISKLKGSISYEKC